jgi:hypothetical protein
MIRQLAQCPYCQRCELALDDNPQLVFNPEGGPPAPCPHLAWVDGRYEQRERTTHGTERVIGSTEFHWDSNGADAEEQIAALLPYLYELLEAGPGWPFAPSIPFTIQRLSAEGKANDSKGKPYTAWEVDGAAVFAQDPTAFWSALPECQERHLKSLELGGQG